MNVVICRLETKESIFIGRSHCPKCGTVLKWYDLIPVLSFLFQKGECRYCHKKISWQYPLVEILTALIFLLFFSSIYYLVITCFLIIIFVYDLKHYIIPDKIVYPAIVITLVSAAFYPPLTGFYFLLSAFLASGFFLSIVLISKGKWMGLGDVKLAFLMGLVLGWPNILFALFLAFSLGAVIGIILIVLGKKNIKSEIPFGPFLAGATIFAMLYNQNMVDWYLNLVF